jgi:hypothetical protein
MNTADISKFINIDSKNMKGWFYPADMISFWMLNEIQKALNMNGSVCEVGVFEGKSLTLLSQFCRGTEKAYGYDLFPDGMKDRAWDNIQKYGNPDCAELKAIDTSKITFEGLRNELSNPCRFLHIDAGHEYHEVLHQLLLFCPFISRGGCLIMDDYQDREFPGIEAAVLDFCELDRPRRFVPFFSGGNKMYLCEKNMASLYQKSLLKFEPVNGKSRVSRVRDFNILVGFSKLPVSAEACARCLDEQEFPLAYESDLDAISRKAGQLSQITFGSGILIKQEM